MYHCAECKIYACKTGEFDKMPKNCPSKNDNLQEQIKACYQEEENHLIAYNAGVVEAEGYGQLCRMEEIMLFAQRANYNRIGLLFCIGLKNEAETVSKILRHNEFEVISVLCKNGAIPKSFIGLSDKHTISGKNSETMCNPIGQALLLNESKTQFNILLGLCVGHDSLVLKHLEAPTTILAVKDRVTGHNPLAAIYMAEGYYKKRFFKDKKQNG